MRIVFPSGFCGEARKLRGHEIQAVADRIEEDATIADGSSTIAPLLAGVWLGTTDPGPYSFVTAGETSPEWSRLLKADVIGALFQVRVGSFRDGHIYQFPAQCPACKKRYDCDVDIKAVILDKMKPVPEATCEAIRKGEALTAHLSDGRAVKFRMTTMADDMPAAKLRKQLVRAGVRGNDSMTIVDHVAMMVVSVEGQNHMDPKRVWLWARELDLDELYGLTDQFDAQTGGYDTVINAKCPHCKHIQELDLPLGRTFLDPRRRQDSAEEEETTESSRAATGANARKISDSPEATGTG